MSASTPWFIIAEFRLRDPKLPSLRSLLAPAVWFAASSVWIVALAGCDRDDSSRSDDAKPVPSASPSVPQLAYRLTPEEQAKAEALPASINAETRRFPSKEAHRPKNARVFTYLAATTPRPEVAAAALSGMTATYSSHSNRKTKPDADFVTAVSLRLRDKDDAIVAQALKTARVGISGNQGNADLVRQVTSLADRYPSGPGRYALIDALRVVGFTRRSDALMDVFYSSLDDREPYVLSYALQALYRSSRSIKAASSPLAKALELSRHPDPGVRGRALELLGAIGRNNPEVAKAMVDGLKDPHPYVRSEAAEGNARLRHKPAIHPLMNLVDQKEPNGYEIVDWKTLSGGAGRLQHDGSAWGYVQDAAMNAIRSLSGGSLKLTRIMPKHIDAGLAKNVSETKAWYKQAKDSLPKLPPSAPTEYSTPIE